MFVNQRSLVALVLFTISATIAGCGGDKNEESRRAEELDGKGLANIACKYDEICLDVEVPKESVDSEADALNGEKLDCTAKQFCSTANRASTCRTNIKSLDVNINFYKGTSSASSASSHCRKNGGKLTTY
jgi:hypothetical protein